MFGLKLAPNLMATKKLNDHSLRFIEWLQRPIKSRYGKLLTLILLFGPTHVYSDDIQSVYGAMLNKCVQVVQSRSIDTISSLELYSARKEFSQLKNPNLRLFQTMYYFPLKPKVITVLESETNNKTLLWSCGFYIVRNDVEV